MSLTEPAEPVRRRHYERPLSKHRPQVAPRIGHVAAAIAVARRKLLGELEGRNRQREALE